jgi:hypothetical protein
MGVATPEVELVDLRADLGIRRRERRSAEDIRLDAEIPAAGNRIQIRVGELGLLPDQSGNSGVTPGEALAAVAECKVVRIVNRTKSRMWEQSG